MLPSDDYLVLHISSKRLSKLYLLISKIQPSSGRRTRLRTIQMTDIRSFVRKEKWFHALDFGEISSSGRFKPGQPQNITLYGFMDLVKHINLAGITALDIGATDGLASFGMKKLGAASVHATDSTDKATFRFAREYFGLDVEYHPRTQIRDLTTIFSPGMFDFILCAGVFYHMLNPVSALMECRKILKNGGLLVLETAV